MGEKVLMEEDWNDRSNWRKSIVKWAQEDVKTLYNLLNNNSKSHNNNNSQPRLTPRGRLLEYFVDPQHLAAHRTTISSSRAKFKVRLLLGPPTYMPS